MTGQDERAATPRRRAARISLQRGASAFLLALLLASAAPTAVTDSAVPASGAPLAATPLPDLPVDLTLAVASTGVDSGTLFIRDPGSRVLAERGGRVAKTRLPTVQARFAAGSVLAGGDIITSLRAEGDRQMRTALAGPSAFGAGLREASLFSKPSEATATRVASARLKPSVTEMALRTRATAKRSADTDDLSVMAAYAPAESSQTASLFDNVLKQDPRGFVPPIGEKDHSWAASVLPPSSFSEKEQTCLARGVYFEARGESEVGQAAVAQVILNRVRNPTYPKTICGVVYQNQHWRNRCQFSFACDGIPDRIWNKRAYETAERIAKEVTTGETWLPEVGSATHYHATYVSPRWARSMQKVDKIGLHVFYRTFGGGWR